ncbi:sensor histidine kinase [Humisphaera borealis]|uniref:histidine kinase n=1 Tax=Humisphaera borealis TaxID=2807512 RepID=A0A7M2WZJ2_9BACT|nr:HAMP domain-containing sensor histidine kinase [Humisphaera borealis]QOV90813.1 HAMP domain-containing histidine kinase [Humisphaera borealis]
MSEQHASQLAQTLAMASEPPLRRLDAGELQRIGAELMKTRGVVAVAFFDANGSQLAVASVDPDIEQAGHAYFANPRERTAELGVPTAGWAASLGRYVELTSPVRQVSTAAQSSIDTEPIGYVTICLSQAETDARGQNVRLSVLLIGAVAVLVCVPMMYLLVHHVFTPIRQLVAATQRIARGELETSVAVDRADLIGTLARSFNDMVHRVRSQQSALAESNSRLETANASLAQNNHELEVEVQRRTGELQQANERLRQEIAEKDDFMRTVSHDLNAPLRNIDGMVSMLLNRHRDSFDADVVHRLERIQKNVEVETSLIGELLELSRIKTRRHKMEPIRIVEVVHEVSDLVSQDLESRDIRFVVDSDFPILVCERSRMRQLLQNLVDNAIKYMGPGSDPARLRAAGIELMSECAPGQLVREIHVGCRSDREHPEFFVRDTGLGIDPDDMKGLFRVFRRGKSPSVQCIAGKGVGLASVKSIVETYGGSIRVESLVGVGSTFRFTIDRKYLYVGSLPDTAKESPGQRAA